MEKQHDRQVFNGPEQAPQIDAFLTKMQGLTAKTKATGGRLIFALDATASPAADLGYRL